MSRGAIDLVGGVRLDERGHAELEREGVQARQHVLLERRDDEQDEVGAGGARLEHLVLGGDEVLAQHRQADGGLDGDEVGEAALEPAALGEDRDRGRAALLVEAGLVGGIRDGGEVAARGARALHLGDDLDAVGGSERGERVERRRLRERGGLDGRQRLLGGSGLGILNRAGREVGEHASMLFRRVLRAVDAVAGLGHAPADERPDDDDARPTIHTTTGMSRKKKNVPIATPTSMMMTAVQAAGECP